VAPNLLSPIRHVFGLKGDVTNNIFFIDEQNLAYPAGANLILYNTEAKSQRFIPVTDKCEGITALAITSNKRYVAVAERGEKPVIVVYDLHTLRRRKVLTAPAECEAKVCPSLFF
jgi:cilia- and flagella-associated protein 57